MRQCFSHILDQAQNHFTFLRFSGERRQQPTCQRHRSTHISTKGRNSHSDRDARAVNSLGTGFDRAASSDEEGRGSQRWEAALRIPVQRLENSGHHSRPSLHDRLRLHLYNYHPCFVNSFGRSRLKSPCFVARKKKKKLMRV